MLLCELDPNTDLKDVDLLDDLHFFMTNDPKFYRQVLHPVVSILKKHLKNDTQCDHSLFIPTVDSAVKEYCQKFKLEGNPSSVFTGIDRDELARKIFDQQAEHIKSQDKKKSGENYFFESDKDKSLKLDPVTGRVLRHISQKHPYETDELAAFIADTEERLEHLESDQQFDKAELKAIKAKMQALSVAMSRIKK